MNESLTFCAATRSIEDPELHPLKNNTETMTANRLHLVPSDEKVLEIVITAPVAARFTIWNYTPGRNSDYWRSRHGQPSAGCPPHRPGRALIGASGSYLRKSD